MNRPLRSLLLAVVLVTTAVAFSARAGDGAVKVMKDGTAGSYLADAKGMTLYTFKKDSPGTSACAGECLAKWPIFYQEKVAADAGLAAGFGTITRADGKPQTTYQGKPLYYFAGDKAAGELKGQGLKDVWYAAAP